MHSFYDPTVDMDETTLHAWQFYLAVAELALSELKSLRSGQIAITDDYEHAYWLWQGEEQAFLAWAPIADEQVCFEAAILLVEAVGLSAEEIDYRRESLTRWLQSASRTTLAWPKQQLQHAIRINGQN
ncbi:hypothetical protein HZU75_02105 [Chitinibacter fontanus]|uniref:Uncharacterized protein n=1 Tax=Chitinibacter fontanus TaxID=1737446 RepID=A0A7D5Z9N6_9NEIS|nr:hypothetical protein [Chitinibacter fontanus]QLI80426.1 hypothetical protein HZU75_02105 [Chitinibacter fontanus]